jgi:hypothetical protein
VGAASVVHRTLVPPRLARGVEHEDVGHELESLVDFCSVETGGFVGTHYVPSAPIRPIDVVLEVHRSMKVCRIIFQSTNLILS